MKITLANGLAVSGLLKVIEKLKDGNAISIWNPSGAFGGLRSSQVVG